MSSLSLSLSLSVCVCVCVYSCPVGLDLMGFLLSLLWVYPFRNRVRVQCLMFMAPFASGRSCLSLCVCLYEFVALDHTYLFDSLVSLST